MAATVHVHPAHLPRHSEDSDERIIERVRAGETQMYAVIMRRYNQRLYRSARAIVQDDAEAEDVVQQAYVSAYQHLDQFLGEARFSTWLTRIAIHEALARARRSRRLREVVDEMQRTELLRQDLAVKDPEEAAAGSELARLLESAIDALPEPYRVVVMLRDVETLSTLETAEALSLSEENVRVRLHRARTLLRHELYERAGRSGSELFAFAGDRCDRIVRRVFDRLRVC